MDESTPQSVTSLPKQSRFRLNKQKAIKVAAATTAGVLGVVYLKRKFNGNCSVSADAHVETAEPTDN